MLLSKCKLFTESVRGLTNSWIFCMASLFSIFQFLVVTVTFNFQTLAEKVIAVLPWSLRQIHTSFDDIISAITRIARNPKTAISDIGKSTARYINVPMWSKL